jgi:hypothetical protein
MEGLRAELAMPEAWRSVRGRKPFQGEPDLLHLVVTLPPGLSRRADVSAQLHYRAQRYAARLGYHLDDHKHLFVQHTETTHAHGHLLLSKFRCSDSAYIAVDPMHHWRAVAIERDLMTRAVAADAGHSSGEWDFAPIGGGDRASLAASRAMELGEVTGRVCLPDGHRSSYPLYGHRAARRVLAWAGEQSAADRIPGGLAKVLLVGPSRLQAGAEDVVEYLVGIR